MRARLTSAPFWQAATSPRAALLCLRCLLPAVAQVRAISASAKSFRCFHHASCAIRLPNCRVAPNERDVDAFPRRRRHIAGGAVSQNRLTGSVAQNNPFVPASSQRKLSENIHPEDKPSECAACGPPRAPNPAALRAAVTWAAPGAIVAPIVPPAARGKRVSPGTASCGAGLPRSRTTATPRNPSTSGSAALARLHRHPRTLRRSLSSGARPPKPLSCRVPPRPTVPLNL